MFVCIRLAVKVYRYGSTVEDIKKSMGQLLGRDIPSELLVFAEVLALTVVRTLVSVSASPRVFYYGIYYCDHMLYRQGLSLFYYGLYCAVCFMGRDSIMGYIIVTVWLHRQGIYCAGVLYG